MKMSDGPLTVQMIAQLQGLDTSNEMVVLSACDTAVEAGKSTGDELVSVAVAFSMAGSPALVASLWEVSDESTGELMASFYRALETNKGDRLDALREAKLSLLRTQKGTTRPFTQPWHWSSFQLYGDYRSPGAK
jgi:CHAT domain-containing protein